MDPKLGTFISCFCAWKAPVSRNSRNKWKEKTKSQRKVGGRFGTMRGVSKDADSAVYQMG